MIYSLNEVGATLRKAAIGSGFPTGTADDLAAAGVWLCGRDLDGAGAVLSAITTGFDRPESWLDDGTAFRLASEAVCRHGISPFELLMAHDADRIEVRSPTPQTYLLLIGLAAVATPSEHAGFSFSTGSRRLMVVTSRSLQLKVELPTATLEEIQIRRAGEDAGVMVDDHIQVHGIEVDERDWATANDLAAKTYVPATEQSRLHGAGAGLTDND